MRPHKNTDLGPLCLRGKYKGNEDGFCEGLREGVFNRMMQWVKTIKTALDKVIKTVLLPFPRRHRRSLQ